MTPLLETRLRDDTPDAASVGVQVVGDGTSLNIVLHMPDGQQHKIQIERNANTVGVRLFRHDPVSPSPTAPGDAVLQDVRVARTPLVEIVVGDNDIFSVLNDAEGEALLATQAQNIVNPPLPGQGAVVQVGDTDDGGKPAYPRQWMIYSEIQARKSRSGVAGYWSVKNQWVTFEGADLFTEKAAILPLSDANDAAFVLASQRMVDLNRYRMRPMPASSATTDAAVEKRRPRP